MGYTHYWSNKTELPQDKWDSFIKEVKTVIKSLPKYCTTAGQDSEDEDNAINLTGCSLHEKAIFNKNKILFNGGDGKGRHQNTTDKGEKYWVCDVEHGLDCETFYLSRKGIDSPSFCKTARRPYDFAVCAVLTLYAKHFGAEATDISSDGNWEDWEPAVRLIKETVGLGALNVLTEKTNYGTKFNFTEGKIVEFV